MPPGPTDRIIAELSGVAFVATREVLPRVGEFTADLTDPALAQAKLGGSF